MQKAILHKRPRNRKGKRTYYVARYWDEDFGDWQYSPYFRYAILAETYIAQNRPESEKGTDYHIEIVN